MLDSNQAMLYNLLAFTFRTNLTTHQHHRDHLQQQTNNFLEFWLVYHQTKTQSWAITVAMETCRDEILLLTRQNSGFQFRATHADLDQVETFSMVKMGNDLKRMSPYLWRILGVLLDSPLRQWAAPNLHHTSTEDVEMDLGEIGGEGAQEVEHDHWADLVDSDESSCDEQSEDEQENIADKHSMHGVQSDSDYESESNTSHPQKKRQQKQNPARHNAILLAIVSSFF